MTIQRTGSRAQVFHGKAMQTAGGLKKKNLFKDKHGCIKSKKASKRARKNRNLGGMLKQKGSGCFEYNQNSKIWDGGWWIVRRHRGTPRCHRDSASSLGGSRVAHRPAGAAQAGSSGEQT